MDWNVVIERNREKLQHILASLVAMAGLPGTVYFLPQNGASPSGSGLAEKSKLPPAPTLPRRLYRTILRLLRPAEAAARRLVIVAARELVATPREAIPPRPRKPAPTSILVRTHADASMLVPRYLLPQVASISRPRPRRLALPLLDPLPRWGGHRRSPARGVPRISIPGLTERLPVPPPPSPDDPIDVTRLALRLDALGRALDDLPREARRFARWRARADAEATRIKQTLDAAGVQLDPRLYGAGAQNRKGVRRFRRIDPLRPGRPPGSHKRSGHEIQDVLKDLQYFALHALEQFRQRRAEPRDTS